MNFAGNCKLLRAGRLQKMNFAGKIFKLSNAYFFVSVVKPNLPASGKKATFLQSRRAWRFFVFSFLFILYFISQKNHCAFAPLFLGIKKPHFSPLCAYVRRRVCILGTPRIQGNCKPIRFGLHDRHLKVARKEGYKERKGCPKRACRALGVPSMSPPLPFAAGDIIAKRHHSAQPSSLRVAHIICRKATPAPALRTIWVL